VLKPPVTSAEASGLVISGARDELAAVVDGGAGNAALATRAIGERFVAGDGFALDRADSGLCDEAESSWR
jgi:hypothetical protein